MEAGCNNTKGRIFMSKKVGKKSWSKKIECNARVCDRCDLLGALASGGGVYLDVVNRGDYHTVGAEIPINLVKRVRNSIPDTSVHCYYFEGDDHGIVEYRGQYDFLHDKGWFQWRHINK